MGILKNNGVLNNVLMWLGVIDQPLVILHTNLAVSIGVVYTYLPIMILPIYTALTRLDYSLVEASLDLGARPLKTFFQVIVPLTKGGIIAGSMLVFIPAVGEYVIPELLGGPDSIMIVRILWQEFFNNRDWPVASAVVMPDVITGLSLLLLFVALGHAIGWPAERDMSGACHLLHRVCGGGDELTPARAGSASRRGGDGFGRDSGESVFHHYAADDRPGHHLRLAPGVYPVP